VRTINHLHAVGDTGEFHLLRFASKFSRGVAAYPGVDTARAPSIPRIKFGIFVEAGAAAC